MFRPAYLNITEAEFIQRINVAFERLSDCDLCPRECRKNRLEGELGVCKTGKQATVSSFNPHHGEESPLSGWNGSGTIFFSRCNLHCQYCQNFEISQHEDGQTVSADRLAQIMLALQAYGCHNINFVTPSHVVAQILEAVYIARSLGLHIPLVYNTGGYDSVKTLELLEGVFDIYMPDMKYASRSHAKKYSLAADYPQRNRDAVREMHRQVGDLQIDPEGLAERGLLVRHLVLPHNLAGTEAVICFLAEEISTNTYLNLMDQYRPAYQAARYPELNRRLSLREYREAVELARNAGLVRLDEPRRLFFI